MTTEPDIWGFNKTDATTLADIARSQGMKGDNRLLDRGLTLRGKYLCYLAKTVGTISARVDDVPGTGTVTIQTVKNGKIVDFVYEGETQTREVSNFVAETSGSNVYVWVGYDAFGTLWYLNEACEDV